jgi:nucleotide-binding universal stress UspA family protein
MPERLLLAMDASEHAARRSRRPSSWPASAAGPDPPPAGLHRILVPLDGTPDAARAVEQAACWFAGSAVGIVRLHVFEPPPCRASGTGPSATTPLVAGVPGPQRPGGRSAPEVSSGWPSDRILEVAGTERADMITLGWRRRLAPDRAAVVRDVLARTPVPVILLPHAA